MLLDADKHCPQDLAGKLTARCRAAHADLSVSIVIAKVEYEAWFLAAAKSLSGHHGLPMNLEPPPDPESIQGAKEWLSADASPPAVYRNKASTLVLKLDGFG